MDKPFFYSEIILLNMESKYSGCIIKSGDKTWFSINTGNPEYDIILCLHIAYDKSMYTLTHSSVNEYIKSINSSLIEYSKLFMPGKGDQQKIIEQT